MDVPLRLLVLAAVLIASYGGAVALRRYFRNADIPSRFDRCDAAVDKPGALLVEFTSPYCYECQQALPLLQAASLEHDAPLAVIDAKERPDLTAKYSIRTTPTILVVNDAGKVTSGWLTSPSEEDLGTALQLAQPARV